jgi:hypothetical protein
VEDSPRDGEGNTTVSVGPGHDTPTAHNLFHSGNISEAEQSFAAAARTLHAATRIASAYASPSAISTRLPG